MGSSYNIHMELVSIKLTKFLRPYNLMDSMHHVNISLEFHTFIHFINSTLECTYCNVCELIMSKVVV